MAEPTVPITDYDALAEEFRRVAGPVASSLKYIQDGIEMESFRDTRAGKVIIGRSVLAMQSALELILDPNCSGRELLHAVNELRVQHRVLDTIAETVSAGRAATKQLAQMDLEELENPDEL